MKLINADKYKKDIEHYRNTICYQRNVTMDDCIRILDNQEDVLNKIKAEITEYKDDQIIHAERNEIIDIVLGIIDKYKGEQP